MVRRVPIGPGGWRKQVGKSDNADQEWEGATRRTLATAPWNKPSWPTEIADRLAGRVVSAKMEPAFAMTVRNAIHRLVQLEFRQLSLSADPLADAEDRFAWRSQARALLGLMPRADRSIHAWVQVLEDIISPIVAAVADRQGLTTSASFRVPLIDVVPRANELVSTIVGRILTLAPDAAAGLQPGAALAGIVKAALLRHSKLSDEAARKNPHRIISPKHSDLRGIALVETFLAETPLAGLLTAPVLLPLRERFSHQHIVATPNAGKTNLLGVQICGDLEEVARGRATVIVLDSQGDFENAIVHLADFAPGGRLWDRLVFIDPTDVEYPLALNIFARGSRPRSPLEKRSEYAAMLDMLLFLFGAVRQEVTGRQETLLRAVAALIQEIPDATLLTLNDVFEPLDRKKVPVAKFQPYLANLDPAIREFFATDFNNIATFGQSREQIRARLQSLITDDVFRNMFDTAEQKLDLAAEMNAGKVILINAHKDLLKSSTEVFGRFFIALVAQAVQGRANIAEAARMPTYFYVDEAHDYIKADTNMENMLDTARKYKCGLILAHQRNAQLSQALRSATSMAAIKMVRAPVLEDKQTLADQLFTTTKFIDALPPRCFATHMSGMDTAVALEIPRSPLDTSPRMSDAHFQQLRDLMRRKYAKTITKPRRVVAPIANQTPPPPLRARPWDSDRGED